MYLERLVISLEQPYGKPSLTNKYKATIEVGYTGVGSDNKMKVGLSDEACKRILMLAGEEIAKAASFQIDDFVRKALAINEQPLIEGSAS